MNSPATKTSPKSAPKPVSWAYAEDFVEESEAATAARQSAGELGVTPLGRGAASTLTVLARAVQAKAVVEIGTGSGVSGLALFAGMQPDGILTSVDIETEHQQAARKAFLSIGIPTQRFRLIAGSGAERAPPAQRRRVRPGLHRRRQGRVRRVRRAGGPTAPARRRHSRVDNALWHDRTADPSNTDEQTEAIRAALAAIADNEDLISTLLPVGDGLLVAVKR